MAFVAQDTNTALKKAFRIIPYRQNADSPLRFWVDKAITQVQYRLSDKETFRTLKIKNGWSEDIHLKSNPQTIQVKLDSDEIVEIPIYSPPSMKPRQEIHIKETQESISIGVSIPIGLSDKSAPSVVQIAYDPPIGWKTETQTVQFGNIPVEITFPTIRHSRNYSVSICLTGIWLNS